ncbi:uncharacterized protein CTRU02_215349 [Colletotrichum truncatum]|uniref:Uncharacterized protein n=1 Tax=Colletotrichum truncatum TaxID=5467 RepID=A0ACC3YCY2_COLTU|nr:uncharacterized protein CTRU02_13304 [Colletotrichum truncatum]KAF6783541.1 hypothetical protein CTRU02_13304 [Colletotrichum truncatum]
MSPSAKEQERFDDKDEKIGRPRSQQAFIDYASRVIEKDIKNEVWHPWLRTHIMRSLETAVTVSSLRVPSHISYKNLTKFARGEKQPITEAEMWATLFRTQNLIPSIWEDTVNSGSIWAFSDVIRAVRNEESSGAIKELYEKTRKLKYITYFVPASDRVPQGISSMSSCDSTGNGNKIHSRSDMVEIENTNATSDSNKMEVTASSSSGNFTTQNKRPHDEVVDDSDSDDFEIIKCLPSKKPKLECNFDYTDGAEREILPSSATVAGDEAAPMDMNIEVFKTNTKQSDDDTTKDIILMDTWMVEAMRSKSEATKPQGAGATTPKPTAREKVRQRNAFFKTLAAAPEEHKEMIFRTVVLDALQDLGVDPNVYISRQMESFEAAIIANSGSGQDD